MNRPKGRPVDSLVSLTVKYIAENIFDLHNLETIALLPNHLKERILHIFTTSKWFWRKVDFKVVLKALVNKNVQHLNLTECVVDDEILNIIEPCVNLRSLHLTGCEDNKITTGALFNLIPRLPNLNRLYLANCDAVNDAVIACLVKNCPNLEALDAGRCSRLTDRSLKSLSELEGLAYLTYSYTQVTDAGIWHLVRGKSGPELKELRVSQCLSISEKILKPIGIYCRNIEVLIFHNCQKINGNYFLDEYSRKRRECYCIEMYKYPMTPSEAALSFTPMELYRDYQTCFSFEEGSLKNLKQINWTIEW